VVLGLQLAGALLAALASLWLAYASVMSSERLRVKRVEVRGSNFLSESEVRELLGPAVGENILRLDIDELKAHLRASPWVRDAAVGRTLPDTLKVDVRERVPVALAELGRLFLMDADGVVIDEYGPRTSAFDLPIVRGLDGLDAESRRERAQRAGALLRELEELAAEVSEVRVEDSGDLRVVLRGTPAELRMAPPFRKAFLTFLGLREELTERCPDAEYFDLRFRDRIYARQPATAAPRAAAPAPFPPPAQPALPAREAAQPPPSAAPGPALVEPAAGVVGDASGQDAVRTDNGR
jgi:cell division protein FtsQ